MAILDLQRRSLLDWSAIFGQNLKKSIFFHSHPQYSTSPTGVLKSKDFFSNCHDSVSWAAYRHYTEFEAEYITISLFLFQLITFLLK